MSALLAGASTSHAEGEYDGDWWSATFNRTDMLHEQVEWNEGLSYKHWQGDEDPVWQGTMDAWVLNLYYNFGADDWQSAA